jgi:preprotein translocase subunit SecA
MTRSIREETIRVLYHIKIEQKVEREQVAQPISTNRDDSTVQTPKTRSFRKVYPNDPCPCGSGKKYKQCHGRTEYLNSINEKIVERKADKANEEMMERAGKD